MLANVLVVDDDARLTRNVSRYLKLIGYEVAAAHSARKARAAVQSFFPDLVLLDLGLPDCDGCDLMQELREDHPQLDFIIITADDSIQSAVKSTRLGALDYLTKPFEMTELHASIRNALRHQELNEEVRKRRSQEMDLAPRRKKRYRSREMRQALLLAEKASALDGMVLLLGESGAGKDYLARYIHGQSARRDAPFFCINCAALPHDLAESELFGHEPGAFTGTRGRKRGLLEVARGGTLLLNEIGELSPALQSKLLTFLDSKTIVRVGGEKSVSVDTRIITATNRDLAAEVDQGHFRADLFYRLNVFPIVLPPLRQRLEDLPLLVPELLAALSQDLGLRQVPSVSERAFRAIKGRPWPGNIRELRNVLEAALMHSQGETITDKHLGLARQSSSSWKVVISFPEEGLSLKETRQHLTRQLVEEALRRGGTKKRAAALLGISRHALSHQLKSLGIKG